MTLKYFNYRSVKNIIVRQSYEMISDHSLLKQSYLIRWEDCVF